MTVGLTTELRRGNVIYADATYAVQPIEDIPSQFAMRPMLGSAANQIIVTVYWGKEAVPGWRLFTSTLDVNAQRFHVGRLPGMLYTDEPSDVPSEIIHMHSTITPDHSYHHNTYPRMNQERCPWCASAEFWEGMFTLSFRCEWIKE